MNGKWEEFVLVLEQYTSQKYNMYMYGERENLVEKYET